MHEAQWLSHNRGGEAYRRKEALSAPSILTLLATPLNLRFKVLYLIYTLHIHAGARNNGHVASGRVQTAVC